MCREASIAANNEIYLSIGNPALEIAFAITPKIVAMKLRTIFDDSSSISSGDISDTIAEISTDENLTGIFPGLDVFLSHLQGSKRAPSLGTSAFMGTDYHSDSGIGTGPNAWRKYSLPQDQQTVEQRPQ
nr:hypothetical protein BaRGS_009247 [Batillaria attramentaria]